ncbi:YceH family protein [Pseudomonadota bacterium]
MNDLTPIQARVLGCLIEKKETTPEQYPLTLNALKNACNQKTARNPVTSYHEGDVGHTLRELESLGLVREAWGARVAKYEHHADKVMGVHSKGLALLCPLMLRGPQTLGELRTNAHRLYDFDDLDDVQYVLERLAEHEPPLVMTLPRQPGQKETRFAHLLCGEPDIPEPAHWQATSSASSGLVERIEALETEVANLRDQLESLTNPD